MGQYKVPQNVEAEDKIIGPLTLKQFIYCLIGVAWFGLCFALLRSVMPLMIAVAAPVTLIFLLLGLYQKDGQNFEQLLIALTSFLAQPRRRVWEKEQVAETFHIEPTKMVAVEQSQRNPAEIRSELDRLASLVDARGHNPIHDRTAGDRLVAPQPVIPQKGHVAEPVDMTDMMDLQNSPLAQNLSQLLEEASRDVREEAVHAMEGGVASPHLNQKSIRGSAAMPPNGIIRLATDSDDISVAQLAAQAGRINPLVEGESVRIRS